MYFMHIKYQVYILNQHLQNIMYKSGMNPMHVLILIDAQLICFILNIYEYSF